MSAPESSLWRIALRPKWIAALILALGVATGCAALGQWQLARSSAGGAAPTEQTESMVPLDTVSAPQQPVAAAVIGQRVTVEASFVAGDFVVLSDRVNLSEPGYWVVGHAVASNGASLAVAMGWAADADVASAALRRLEKAPPEGTITGRYLPSESPQESDFEAGRRSTLAVSELANLWVQEPEGVYGGYLVADAAASGLDLIDSPRPITEAPLNLLNVFYAIEWVIFSGFVIFLWYRLLRDAWEAEQLSVSDSGAEESVPPALVPPVSADPSAPVE
ncbi:MAG: SURF1 family protein [Rhodoglobus sp.]